MVSMGDMMTVYVKKEHGPPTQWQARELRLTSRQLSWGE